MKQNITIGLSLLTFSFIMLAVGILPSTLIENGQYEGLTVNGEYLGIDSTGTSFDYVIVASYIENGVPVEGHTLYFETRRAVVGQSLPSSWTTAGQGMTDNFGKLNPANGGVFHYNIAGLDGYYQQARFISQSPELTSNVIEWEFGKDIEGNTESTVLNIFTILGILTTILSILVLAVTTKK